MPVVTRLADALAAVAAVAIALLCLVTCWDVVARYLFNAPIRGSLEILDMLVCLSIFPALPRLCRRRTHISVDLIDAALTPRSRAALLRVIDLACAVALAVVAWRMSVYARKLLSYGDETLLLQVPLYPYAFLVSAMAAVAALTCIAVAIAQPADADADPSSGQAGTSATT
jgi:TRAP-type C4-dicarboxylate transport system permease small subunit